MPSLNFERENALKNTDNHEPARGRAHGKPNYRKKHSPRKCMHLWKTSFFHVTDIAVVNSFILFQIHRARN